MALGETALLVIKGWLIYVVVAGLLASPIVFFGRKRVHWFWWEALVFVLPFFIWTALMFSELATGRKSLSNLGEFVFICFAVPIAALVRVAAGKAAPERVCAGGLLTLVCLTAAAVFWLTPRLPE